MDLPSQVFITEHGDIADNCNSSVKVRPRESPKFRPALSTFPDSPMRRRSGNVFENLPIVSLHTLSRSPVSAATHFLLLLQVPATLARNWLRPLVLFRSVLNVAIVANGLIAKTTQPSPVVRYKMAWNVFAINTRRAH